MNKFHIAQDAFEFYYDLINEQGFDFDNTKALFNIGFYIENPMLNSINTDYRDWNKNYADFEWRWYKSGDPHGYEISRRAPIWKKHMDLEGKVRSNYGWQWNRMGQIYDMYSMLRKNPSTRKAVLSFYDGKEINTYKYDTPCTNTVHFQIINQKLCMTINMRSNDLWYGFCNDQYCFSKLQEMVSNELNIEIGWYYHFASNLHLYNNFLNKNN